MKLKGETTTFDNVAGLEAQIYGLPQFHKSGVAVGPAPNSSNDFLVNWGLAKGYTSILENDTERLAGIRSDKYALVQHREAFLPFVDVCRTLGMDAEGKIITNRGKAFVFATFKDEKAKILVNGDEVRMGLLFGNSVDGSMGLFSEGFGFRGFCSNGMILGKVLGFKVYQIHVGTPEAQREHYKELIQELIDNCPRVSELMEKAMAEEIHQELIQLIFSGAGFGKRQCQKLMEKVQRLDIRNRWDLYNVVTSWITHDVEVQVMTQKAYHNIAADILTEPIAVLVEAGKKRAEPKPDVTFTGRMETLL